MLRPEPDKVSVDAWLAGELPDDEVVEVEKSIDLEASEILPFVDPEVLRELSATERDDDALAMVIARVKSGLSCEALAPKEDSWREVLSPSDDPDSLGTVGIYEISEVIATGGMAIVFKGYDPELKRHAAIKVLAPEIAVNATARERFLREARAAARLENENVLPIYSIHDETVPYFAMRYVNGGTLADRIDRGDTFSFEELKFITLGIARALEAAHAAGIVHRDIKPANILLSADRTRLWVCDFGIARCTDDPSLTYAGAIAGTPRFMSPEQAAGEELDGRSDLFSLGSLLYRCATGEFLVGGKTTVAVVRELCTDESAPSTSKLASLPKFYRRLLRSLLAFDRDERPANAAAVIETIESGKTSRSSPQWRTLTAFVVGLILLGLIAFFAVKNITPRTDPVALLLETNTQPGLVTDLGTGTGFSSLANAVAGAKSGATLQIRGLVELEEEVKIKKEIHLISHPEEQGELVVAHEFETDHGVYFFQPGTVQGIRFIDPAASTRERPILGMTVENGTVTIEDCEFLAPRPFVDGEREADFYALGVTNTESATIRRCLFHTRKGIYLAAIGQGEPTSSLNVEDSLFLCSEAIVVRSSDNISTISAEIANTAVVADSFVQIFPLGPVPKLNIRVENSLLALRRNLFDFAEPKSDALSKRLSWTGSRNHYPAELKLLPGISERDPRTEPFEIPLADANSRELGQITDLPAVELLTQLEEAAEVRRSEEKELPEISN